MDNSSTQDQITGCIFDIQRFSIHDGPGIRTTVFLKGCPLSCIWCHNPESKSSGFQLAFYGNKCIGCGHCSETCGNGAILSGDARIDRARCSACGSCAAVCPAQALSVIGRTAAVDEVMATVMRDLPFYKTSGGGITLSGGEPLYQYDYSVGLLTAAREAGLHTAIETCGLASWERLDALRELVDLFLYDVKVIDPEKHRRLCGADNSVILENAGRLAENSANVVFRTPIVPGCNDSVEDIRLLGEFILALPGEHPLELMAYHNISSGKYHALGFDYPLPDVKSPESLDEYKQAPANMGVRLL